MTTGKTIALTRWTFVGKVMPLLLNMLSRLVITFLPRSKHLLILWLQSPSEVISEPKKIKTCHCFHCFPVYLHEETIFFFNHWAMRGSPRSSLNPFIKVFIEASSLKRFSPKRGGFHWKENSISLSLATASVAQHGFFPHTDHKARCGGSTELLWPL